MRSHVSRTVSGCFATPRQIRSIRRSVSDPVVTSLAVSLIMPRLHCGNATLTGLPEYQHRRLHSSAHCNAAARLIYRTSRCQHVTLLLELHRLRSWQPVNFELAVLIFRSLRGLASHYLTDDIRRVVDTNRRCLRSSSSALLTVRSTRLVTMGDRAFPVAGSRLWNSLPHLCSHTLCFLQPSKDTYISAFFPLGRN